MIDPVLLLTTTLAACCGGAAIWLRYKREVRWACAIETAAVLFSGLVSSVLMTGHLAGTIAARLNGEWAHRYNHLPPADVVYIGSFPYDFRFYSMALVAAVVLMHSVCLLRNSRALARGNRDARRSAIRANALLVATVLPLLPWVHFVRLLLVPALLALSVGIIRAIQRRKPIEIRRLAGVSGD